MLTTTYETVKRTASSSTKGFLKQRALAKLDKEIRKGNTTLLYLRNKLSKISISNPYRERNPINTPKLPSFQVNHLCYSSITSRLNEIANNKQSSPSKTLFITEMPSSNLVNLKYKSILHRKLFPNLNEAYLYNQIHLIPFETQRKRPVVCRKVYLNLKSIENECGMKQEKSRNYKMKNEMNEEDVYESERALTEMDWEEQWDKGFHINSNKNKHCRNNSNLHYNSYENGFMKDNGFIQKTLTTYNFKKKSIVHIRKIKTSKQYFRSCNMNYLNRSASYYNKTVNGEYDNTNVKVKIFSNNMKHNKTKFKNFCILTRNNTNTNTITNTTNNTNSYLNTLSSHKKSSNILHKNKLKLLYT